MRARRRADEWWGRLISVIGLGVCLTACGGVTGTVTTSGATGAAGGGGDDDGSAASDTFQVTGTVQTSATTALHPSKDVASTRVTTVIAVSPTARDATCHQATVDADGRFTIGIDHGRPWVLSFIDQSQRGNDMLVGRLRSDALDTLAPVIGSTGVDLGAVTLDTATQTATASTSYTALVSELGLEGTVADLLGALDDIAARYQNPDLDADGTIDCADDAQPFFLDLHLQFSMRIAGARATIADLLDQFLPGTATADYAGIAPSVAYTSAFSSVTTGTVTFEQDVTTNEGGFVAAGTATDAVSSTAFGDYHSFGPRITNTTEPPRGRYVFGVGASTLTFTGLTPPDLATLGSPTDRILPFVRINRTDTACTSACRPASLDYQWLKRTTDGWTPASLAELTLLVAPGSGQFSVKIDGDESRIFAFQIPETSPSGTITWNAANADLEGASAAEVEALITTQLCGIGLSYDDQLGIRHFAEINDAPGTCGL